jgi:uncharacterized protein (DUF488 family)
MVLTTRQLDSHSVVDLWQFRYRSNTSLANAKETLSAELRADSIAYVFLGSELGGRPTEQQFYSDGVADYERMSKSSTFHRGLDRIIEGSKKYRIALMCSERDPLYCHRCLLVGRALMERGIHVKHVLENGRIVSHSEIEKKLLEQTGHTNDDLFAPLAERLAEAYRKQARKVAYTITPRDPGPIAAE